MANPFFISPVRTIAKGATLVEPHGLGVAPSAYGALPVAVVAGAGITLTVSLATTVSVDVVNGDAVNAIDVIIFAACNERLVEQTDAVFAANTLHVADAAGTTHTTLVTNATNGAAVGTSLTKSATENTILRNFPAGTVAGREGTLSTGSIAASGTYTRTLAQLQAAFPSIDFTNLPVEFTSDNPLVTLTLTGGAIANGITCTNLDSVNAQFAVIKVRQIHSFVR